MTNEASKNKKWAIGRAAAIAGISRQSLQYYLMIGLLKASETTPTGRRLFDEDAINKVRLIKKMNENGYPLRAIRDLLEDKLTGLKGPEK